MTVLVLTGGILSLVGMAVWIGLLVWAARVDGRIQREHEDAARLRDHPEESDDG